jgi:hypothetical protein
MIMVCMVLYNAVAFANQKNENTAKEFVAKIFAGDVEDAMKLSGVPFSYDRRELMKDVDNLKKGFDRIVKQNGNQKVKDISAQEVKRTRGRHPDLKDDIIIYQVDFKIKKSHVSLQIFIRRSDGKAVGLYG